MPVNEVERWAEISLWPSVRGDFLLWYAEVGEPEVPKRDHASQPDPRWLLFHQFFRETGGDYWDWLAKHRAT